MGLWHKIRILAGALVHKPFAPRPEKVELDEGAEGPAQVEARRDGAALDAATTEAVDSERVADLITRHRREEGG